MIKLNICDKHTLFCYLSLLIRRDGNVPGIEIHLYINILKKAICLVWKIVVNDECVYSTKNEILCAKFSAT